MTWGQGASARLMLYHGALRLLRGTGLTRLPGLARRGFGAILTLHHVTPAAAEPFDPNRGLAVTPAFLDATLGWLAGNGYRFVSLAELHNRLAGAAAQDDAGDDRVVALTLDDGYRDNRDHALPVFARHGAPFTVFVTPGFCERRAIVWWEVLARALRDAPQVRFDFGAGPTTLPTSSLGEKTTAWCRIRRWVMANDPALAQERVATLAAAAGLDAHDLTAALTMDRDDLVAFARHPLVGIGAHTLTHPMLSRLSAEAALAEMRGSADTLQAWLGERPRFLAYPYGFRSAAAGREFALAAEAGFDLAMTTRPGMLFPAHRRYKTALPRVSLNGEFQNLTELEVLMSGAPFALKNRFRDLDVA